MDRVLVSLVFHTSPRDPLVFADVVLAMALLGLVATWIPSPLLKYLPMAFAAEPNVLRANPWLITAA